MRTWPAYLPLHAGTLSVKRKRSGGCCRPRGLKKLSPVYLNLNLSFRGVCGFFARASCTSSFPRSWHGGPELNALGRDGQRGGPEFRAARIFFYRLEMNRPGLYGALDDDLGQTIEERAPRLLVALLQFGFPFPTPMSAPSPESLNVPLLFAVGTGLIVSKV